MPNDFDLDNPNPSPSDSGESDLDILNSDDDNEEETDDSEETDEDDDELSGPKAKRSKKQVENEDDSDDESDESDDSEESDEEPEESDSDDDSEEEESEEEDLDDSEIDKAIKKKYPDIYKTFPGLRQILQAESKYTELFATPENAMVAANKSAILDNMYGDIISGDAEKVGRFLTAIERQDKGGYEDFAHTFLQSLGKKDPNLYGEVLKLPIKRALQAAFLDGKKAGNKNLAYAAIYAHEYFFGNQDVAGELEERKRSEKPKEQLEWEKEKQQAEIQADNEFTSKVSESASHSLRNAVKRRLDGLNIDDYKLRNIIRDICVGVDQIMGQDKRHLASMNSLFAQAKSSRYTGGWDTRIIQAYLTRARQSINAVQSKVLKEAGIKVKEQKSEKRRIVPSGLQSGSKSGGIKWDKIDKTRTTDADILSDDPKRIKYRS